DQSSAANGNDERVRFGNVLDDLEPDGALAGDRQRVVERVDERAACLFLEPAEALEGLRGIAGFEIDRGTVRAGRRDLGLARSLPHDNERVDAFARRAPGQRLRVV